MKRQREAIDYGKELTAYRQRRQIVSTYDDDADDWPRVPSVAREPSPRAFEHPAVIGGMIAFAVVLLLIIIGGVL